MFGAQTLYQRNRLTQYRYVAFYDSVHVFIYGKLAAFGLFSQFQVRIDSRRLVDTFINGKSLVCFIIFGVLHDFKILKVCNFLQYDLFAKVRKRNE